MVLPVQDLVLDLNHKQFVKKCQTFIKIVFYEIVIVYIFLFADMLHDSERNKMYYEGLKAAIALKRSQGQPVHVLDIGTGTGLLSMMAAKIGADSITAIEEFLPMANRAEKIIRDNGFQGL